MLGMDQTTGPLRPLCLYWKNNGEDIDLGTGYHDEVPQVGATLVFPTGGHGTVWRVTGLHFGLVMPGSMTAARAQRGQPRDFAMVNVFVEPAEGPFE